MEPRIRADYGGDDEHNREAVGQMQQIVRKPGDITRAGMRMRAGGCRGKRGRQKNEDGSHDYSFEGPPPFGLAFRTDGRSPGFEQFRDRLPGMGPVA